jgi:DNA-binding transcriptional LysR family regulator
MKAGGNSLERWPQWQPRSGIVHAVFPSRRGLLPSVRTLLDFLARECTVRRQLVSGAAK